jgi:hypothetical protein
MKICKKHGELPEELTRVEIRKGKYHTYKYTRCLLCKKELAKKSRESDHGKTLMREWSSANKDKISAYNRKKRESVNFKKWRKEYLSKNKERLGIYLKNYRELNRIRYKNYHKYYAAQQRNQLKDRYLSILLHIKKSECPQALIEMKRLQILLHRTAKKLLTGEIND